MVSLAFLLLTQGEPKPIHEWITGLERFGFPKHSSIELSEVDTDDCIDRPFVLRLRVARKIVATRWREFEPFSGRMELARVRGHLMLIYRETGSKFSYIGTFEVGRRSLRQGPDFAAADARRFFIDGTIVERNRFGDDVVGDVEGVPSHTPLFVTWKIAKRTGRFRKIGAKFHLEYRGRYPEDCLYPVEPKGRLILHSDRWTNG